MLIVVVNRLTLQDVTGQPGLTQFFRESAIGLVAPSAIGYRNPSAVFESAAAGAYCRGSDDYGLILGVGEPFEGGTAGAAYARRTGLPAPRSGLVDLGIAAVLQANRNVPHPMALWALGASLDRAGIPRAAFGNSDMDQQVSRMGAALLIDSAGRVPYGDAGADTEQMDSAVPGGFSTNLDKLTGPILRQLAKGAVVCVEYGDLERIERDRGACTPGAYHDARRRAVARLGTWLAKLRETTAKTPIVLLSLVPPPDREGVWKTLGLAAINGGGFRPGLLVSNTTRTPGIIAAIDIAPTILATEGVIMPTDMLGFPASSIPSSGPQPILERWNELIAVNHDMAFPFILALGIVGGVSGGLATWYLIGQKKSAFWGRTVVVLMAICAWIPFILLAPLDQPQWTLCVAAGVLAGFAVPSLAKRNMRFFPLGLATAVVLIGIVLSAIGVIDWIQRSVLSSYQLSGLRFYGIGNEFMGCVIGGVAVPALWRYAGNKGRIPFALIGAWFAFWVLVLGLPRLGANAGGAIGATATFGLVLRALSGRKIRFRDAAIATLAGVAVALTFAILDAVFSGAAPSHLGLAARGVTSGNLSYLWGTILRKVAMNVTLWFKPAAKITVAIFGSIIVLWAIYRDRLLKVVHIDPILQQGLIAIGYGILVTILFNDSGIVSAAFITAYVMIWWLWDAVTYRAGGLPSVRTTHARSRG